jgi:hypothetical protein
VYPNQVRIRSYANKRSNIMREDGNIKRKRNPDARTTSTLLIRDQRKQNQHTKKNPITT